MLFLPQICRLRRSKAGQSRVLIRARKKEDVYRGNKRGLACARTLAEMSCRKRLHFAEEKSTPNQERRSMNDFLLFLPVPSFRQRARWPCNRIPARLAFSQTFL